MNDQATTTATDIIIPEHTYDEEARTAARWMTNLEGPDKATKAEIVRAAKEICRAACAPHRTFLDGDPQLQTVVLDEWVAIERMTKAEIVTQFTPFAEEIREVSRDEGQAIFLAETHSEIPSRNAKRIHQLEQEFAKLAEALLADPHSALDWADGSYEAAAELKLRRELARNLERFVPERGTVATAETFLFHVQKRLLQQARGGTQSSSPSRTMMLHAEQAARAKLLDDMGSWNCLTPTNHWADKEGA